MKTITIIVTLGGALMALNSCSMFGMPDFTAGYITETRQVKTCRTETVTEQRLISSSAKGESQYLTVTEKTPVYKTVTTKKRVANPACISPYVVRNGSCGTTSKSTLKRVTAQNATGSPSIGLVPTMRPLVD